MLQCSAVMYAIWLATQQLLDFTSNTYTMEN